MCHFSIMYPLSATWGVLIKEKNIDIHQARPQLPSISFNSVSNDTTALTIETQNQLQIVTNLLDHSTSEDNSSIINQTTEATISIENSHSNPDVACDTNEYNEDMPSFDCSSQAQAKKKRKRKQNPNEEEEQQQNDTLMKKAPQDDIEPCQSRVPLVNMTNSTVPLRQTKRKRRT